MGTSLSEAQPVRRKETQKNKALVESLWLHQHGRPLAIGFDPEFNMTAFLIMLGRNGVLAKPRPARRHNKLGQVERKHRVIKLLLSRLAHVHLQASTLWLVKFATFISNFLYGNQLESAFELARGCTPSLTVSKLLKVPPEIIEAHKAIVAQRALSKVLRSKAVTPVATKLLTPSTLIYGYVKLQKGHRQWKPFHVLHCDGYMVAVRTARRGPRM